MSSWRQICDSVSKASFPSPSSKQLWATTTVPSLKLGVWNWKNIRKVSIRWMGRKTSSLTTKRFWTLWSRQLNLTTKLCLKLFSLFNACSVDGKLSNWSSTFKGRNLNKTRWMLEITWTTSTSQRTRKMRPMTKNWKKLLQRKKAERNWPKSKNAKLLKKIKLKTLRNARKTAV